MPLDSRWHTALVVLAALSVVVGRVLSLFVERVEIVAIVFYGLICTFNCDVFVGIYILSLLNSTIFLEVDREDFEGTTSNLSQRNGHAMTLPSYRSESSLYPGTTMQE